MRGAAAVTAPSTDASMKSRSEMAMGSTGEKADDPPAPRETNQWGTTNLSRALRSIQFVGMQTDTN